MNIKPEGVRAWISALGGRRFLLCVGAELINTVLFACHRLSEQGYLSTFAGTVAAYLAAAGWQKHVEARSA